MLDFDMIKVGDSSDAGDAIVFSFYDDTSKKITSTTVIDGGTIKSIKSLRDAISSYHKKIIDVLIITHPDADHINGAVEILNDETFKVNAIIANLPWLYSDELAERIDDDRITAGGVESTLKDAYKKLLELEKIAKKKEIKIYEGFRETSCYSKNLMLIGPSRHSYIESTEQHLREIYDSQSRTRPETRVADPDWIDDTIESADKLFHIGGTSPKNETSIITLITDANGTILLTGDAGMDEIDAALKFANDKGYIYQNCTYFQLPHHGSYNCISGKILKKIRPKKCIVSCPTDDPIHPSPAVINSCHKLEIPVFSTKNSSLRCRLGSLPDRDSYSPMEKEPFHAKVELYKDGN